MVRRVVSIRDGPFFMTTHRVYSAVAEKRRLFKEADREVASTLLTTRRVSFFAGRVFSALYGVRHSPNTYTRILGRLIDLQPAMDAGKVSGVRLAFRLLEKNADESFRQARDRMARYITIGPFDTVIQVTPTAKVPVEGEGEIEFAIGNGENTYALIRSTVAPGQENRFFQIAFQLDT